MHIEHQWRIRRVRSEIAFPCRVGDVRPLIIALVEGCGLENGSNQNFVTDTEEALAVGDIKLRVPGYSLCWKDKVFEVYTDRGGASEGWKEGLSDGLNNRSSDGTPLGTTDGPSLSPPDGLSDGSDLGMYPCRGTFQSVVLRD